MLQGTSERGLAAFMGTLFLGMPAGDLRCV